MQTVDLENVKASLEFTEDFESKVINQVPILFSDSSTYFNLNRALTVKEKNLNPISTKWITDAVAEDS